MTDHYSTSDELVKLLFFKDSLIIFMFCRDMGIDTSGISAKLKFPILNDSKFTP
jgi:hypothetical protein